MSRARGRSHPLSVLGFDQDDEGLYRLVLRHSGLAIEEIARVADRSPEELRSSLAPLLEVGLVRIVRDRVTAAVPDVALGRLISDETRRLRTVGEQLDALRSLIPVLQAEHLTGQTGLGEPLMGEIAQGGDVVALFRSLLQQGKGDLLWLRPDQWKLAEADRFDDLVRDAVHDGRRSRALYPARVLEEKPAAIRIRSEYGESVRIIASVPTRMAVLGDAAVVLPERWGVNTDRLLVVRQPTLITAAVTLFERMWERAMPVPGLDGVADERRHRDRALLLEQLAGGAKDEQIARAMGVSLRTVRRRVAEVCAELGVESRFQAGVEAVRRGWL